MNKLQLIESHWQAEHDKNLESVLSYYDEQPEIITPSGRSRGRQEIVASYRQVFGSYQQVTVSITRSFENDTGIVAEYDCELICRDGQVRVARGCNAFTMQGGKIVSLRCYCNAVDF